MAALESETTSQGIPTSSETMTTAERVRQSYIQTHAPTIPSETPDKISATVDARLREVSESAREGYRARVDVVNGNAPRLQRP